MREAYLTGNIGKQPEMFTPEGSEWTCLTFSIANNEETRKEGENWVNITSWMDCEYWTKKPAEWMRKLTKGRKITFKSLVKQQVWTDKETQKQRSKIVFIIQGWPEMGEKSEGHAPASSAPQGNNSYNNYDPPRQSSSRNVNDDYNPMNDPRHNGGNNQNFQDDIPY